MSIRIVQVARDRDDTLELAWMWLPTFIGQNTGLQKELWAAINSLYPPPWEATPEKLDEIHNFACGWLSEHLHIRGLDRYLMAMKEINI